MAEQQVCDVIFATAVADVRGRLAVLYWARSQHYGTPLVLLDWNVAAFTPGSWQEIDDQLIALSIRYRARARPLGVFVESEALMLQAWSLNIGAHTIPPLMVANDYWNALALAASYHLRGGEVGLSPAAEAKLSEQPFGALTYQPAPRTEIDDPTIPAWMYGIVLALDEAAAHGRARAAAGI